MTPEQQQAAQQARMQELIRQLRQKAKTTPNNAKWQNEGTGE